MSAINRIAVQAAQEIKNRERRDGTRKAFQADTQVATHARPSKYFIAAKELYVAEKTDRKQQNAFRRRFLLAIQTLSALTPKFPLILNLKPPTQSRSLFAARESETTPGTEV